MKKLLLFLMVGVITFTAGFLSFGESAKAAMPVQKTKWVVEKKESKPVTYGSWTTLLERNSGTSGSITIKFSKERSNSYSGSIAGSKKDFSAQVGFDVTKNLQWLLMIFIQGFLRRRLIWLNIELGL
ncbi:hypothetical protein CDP55_09035 [Listeria monocytogenes]|nr:hypothetical protein [Listeria monocytogenes]